jgi:hypothetical protein
MNERKTEDAMAESPEMNHLLAVPAKAGVQSA